MRFLELLKISWVGILLKIEIDIFFIFFHFFDVFYFQQSAKWRIKMSWNWWKKHVIFTFFRFRSDNWFKNFIKDVSKKYRFNFKNEMHDPPPSFQSAASIFSYKKYWFSFKNEIPYPPFISERGSSNSTIFEINCHNIPRMSQRDNYMILVRKLIDKIG